MRFSTTAFAAAFLAALCGCQPAYLAPLREDDDAALASAIYAEVKAAGLSSSATAAAVGPAAFPEAGNRLGGMLTQLSKPRDKQRREAALKEISDEMRRSAGFSSLVRFCTDPPGARVRYRLVGDDRAMPVEELTNAREPYSMPVGLYYVWAERNGKPTSSPSERFPIVRPSGITIFLEERLGRTKSGCG